MLLKSVTPVHIFCGLLLIYCEGSSWKQLSIYAPLIKSSPESLVSFVSLTRLIASEAK
jgi:hypothetical protein